MVSFIRCFGIWDLTCAFLIFSVISLNPFSGPSHSLTQCHYVRVFFFFFDWQAYEKKYMECGGKTQSPKPVALGFISILLILTGLVWTNNSTSLLCYARLLSTLTCSSYQTYIFVYACACVHVPVWTGACVEAREQHQKLFLKKCPPSSLLFFSDRIFHWPGAC